MTLAAALFVFTACRDVSVTFTQDVEATGDLVTTTYEFDDFDSIDLSSTFDAIITVGDTPYVEVIANESLVEYLDVRVSDGELRLGLRRGRSINRGTLEATIHLPELVAVEVSGASSAKVTGAFGPNQSYNASGASELFAEGTGTSVSIEASGASDITLELTDVVDVDVDVSGASSVEVFSAERASGDLSGASDLTVPSDTDVDVDTSGSSDINCR